MKNKKNVHLLFAEMVFWFMILVFIAVIIVLSMTPGCGAPQEGIASTGTGGGIGGNQATSANQQGGWNWVWVGGAGTIIGFLTLLAWLGHSRAQDKIQNAYTLDLVRELRGGDHAGDSEHRRHQ